MLYIQVLIDITLFKCTKLYFEFFSGKTHVTGNNVLFNPPTN